MSNDVKRRYNEKIKKVTIEFYLKDKELLDFVEKKGKIQTYIKSLLKSEYEKENG